MHRNICPVAPSRALVKRDTAIDKNRPRYGHTIDNNNPFEVVPRRLEPSVLRTEFVLSGQNMDVAIADLN